MLQDSVPSTSPMLELLPSTTDIDSETGIILPTEVRDMELILPSLPVEESSDSHLYIYILIGLFIIFLFFILKNKRKLKI